MLISPFTPRVIFGCSLIIVKVIRSAAPSINLELQLNFYSALSVINQLLCETENRPNMSFLFGADLS